MNGLGCWFWRFCLRQWCVHTDCELSNDGRILVVRKTCVGIHPAVARLVSGDLIGCDQSGRRLLQDFDRWSVVQPSFLVLERVGAGLDERQRRVDALADERVTFQHFHAIRPTGDGGEQRRIAAVVRFGRIDRDESGTVRIVLNRLDRAADVQRLDRKPSATRLVVHVLHEDSAAVDGQDRVNPGHLQLGVDAAQVALPQRLLDCFQADGRLQRNAAAQVEHPAFHQRNQASRLGGMVGRKRRHSVN